MSRIRRFINQRSVIVASYATNSTGLVFYLDELIQEYRKENLEFEIANYIDFEFVGSNSLISSFIELIISVQSSHKSPIASTTNKMVFDFYMSILNSVNEGNAFLRLSYLLKEEWSGHRFEEDERYVENNEITFLEILLSSFERSMKSLTSIDHLESYINLQRVGILAETNSVEKIFVGKINAEPGW
jgi:hypothetical protein